jgi:hypothetical protein
MGFIIDAVIYDVTYGGNSQSSDAADEYYAGGTLQIELSEKNATVDVFTYLGQLAAAVVINESITALQTDIPQNISLPSANTATSSAVGGLFEIVANLIEDGYTSTVIVEENINFTISELTVATFHQFSLITSSGHTFEWVGAGTNVNAALPSLGGTPLQENQITEVNGGRVYYTSTDEKGDFRIGNDFVINRKTGTITGRTFNKSLFAVMTPYILAIGR